MPQAVTSSGSCDDPRICITWGIAPPLRVTSYFKEPTFNRIQVEAAAEVLSVVQVRLGFE